MEITHWLEAINLRLGVEAYEQAVAEGFVPTEEQDMPMTAPSTASFIHVRTVTFGGPAASVGCAPLMLSLYSSDTGMRLRLAGC